VSTGIGDTLREAREAQGRSLEDAARSVRARTGQLQALEEERFDTFGGEVYAKGFLRSYAQELGIEPGPLLDTFNREVSSNNESASSGMVRPVKTPGPKGTTPPAWVAWVLVAAAVVAGLFFLGLITPGSTPDQASEDGITSAPVRPAPSEEEPAADPEEGAEESETEQPAGEENAEGSEEPEEPEYEGVEVILALEDRSWLRITVDGAVLREETVPAGETLRYEGDEIIIRVGNAGAVRTQFNGEDLGAVGERGQVVELRFTPEGVENI
jgi:cytoskeleton protein RodZ